MLHKATLLRGYFAVRRIDSWWLSAQASLFILMQWNLFWWRIFVAGAYAEAALPSMETCKTTAKLLSGQWRKLGHKTPHAQTLMFAERLKGLHFPVSWTPPRKALKSHRATKGGFFSSYFLGWPRNNASLSFGSHWYYKKQASFRKCGPVWQLERNCKLVAFWALPWCYTPPP